MRLNIRDITKGVDIDEIYGVRDLELADGAKGKFGRCVLFDATGECKAIWFDPPAELNGLAEAKFLCVAGKGDEFNGSTQVKISSAIRANVDSVTPFVKTSSFGKERLTRDIEGLLVGIADEDYALVTSELVLEVFDKMLIVPAAMENHHAFVGGLAEHVMSMAYLADRICAHYKFLYGDDCVDSSLVVAGVLLHDLSKVRDFERDGLGFKMNAHSTLVSHIPDIDARIHRACRMNGVPPEKEDRLRHVVLAHHGLKMFGSPVQPATIEAMIVHYVDMIDSRFSMMRGLMEDLEPGEVSERSWALRGRVVK